MSRIARIGNRQGGIALLIFLTILILGVAWFAVGALGKAAPKAADREVKTGLALSAAKQALLAYAAQYAARSNTIEPGQLPCPESVNLTDIGQASTSCSNSSTTVGRLPWRTLGIDQLRDGDGEPLWYVLSPGFRAAPINFGTPGQLTYDGASNAAVAVILAPGKPLNTLSEPGTPPPGCVAVNQQVATRNAASLDPANFVECGNATVNYANPGTSAWTNDRAIAITAAEWADAIAGAVADRLQRQVAPAMEDWRSTLSNVVWGKSLLPYASAFTDPTLNDYCGRTPPSAWEGMPPTATVASGTCDTNWSSGNASQLGGMLKFSGCTPGADGMRCAFTVALAGLVTPRIDATAPRIAASFRTFATSQVWIRVNGGPEQPATTSNYSGQGVNNAGDGSVRFNVVFPLLSIADNVVVRLENPVDAGLFDLRMQWFLNNRWDRFTYYAVARAATVDPGKEKCEPGDLLNCLEVKSAPPPTNNKRLVLALMGSRPIPPKSWVGGSLDSYLEGDNNVTGDLVFEAGTVTSDFNDRLAACPYRLTDAGGNTVQICN